MRFAAHQHPCRSLLLLLCVGVWLVLTPLRAWAQTVMPWSAIPVSHQAVETAQAPCHDMAAHAAPNAEASHAGTCADCALCHFVAAPLRRLLAPELPAPAGDWRDLAPRTCPPAPGDAPFKPPRR